MKKLLGIFLFLFLTSFLIAQTPEHYNYTSTGIANSFPFNIGSGKMVQWLFGPGEFNQPSPAPTGNIVKFYFFVAPTYPLNSTYTDFYIRMGRTNLTVMPAAFYTGPMDTVYKRASVTVNTPASTWHEFVLDVPFNYYADSSLIVEIGQCASTLNTGFSANQTTIPGRRVYSTGGCPFVYGGAQDRVLNAGVTISQGPVTTQNKVMILPTPGVNTNYVMIPHQAGMVGFQNITIEGWVKIGGTSTANTVLNKGGTSFDYQLGINATTSNPFFRAGTTIVQATTVTVTPNVWTHLAVTYDGTTLRFYKDGALAFSQASTLTLGSSTNEMRIGRGGSDPASGGLDEIRLWSVARSQADIVANMCNKWIPNNATGLKAKWHLDDNLIDSVNGWNGTPLGIITFDTATVCTPTGIAGNTELPRTYMLHQNYPNPFNPVTMINFDIPKAGNIEIKVYDMLGREVAIIMNEFRQPGRYSIGFDGTQLASGVYFYTMRSGDFMETKKMSIIK